MSFLSVTPSSSEAGVSPGAASAELRNPGGDAASCTTGESWIAGDKSAGPLVTAVIPAWNASRYIRAAVDSLRNQTYERLEIVVVDDGSTDETAEIVRGLAAEDRRIRLIEQPNGGVAAARNRGIEAAHGHYIALLDADDVWFPPAVECLVARLEASGERYGVAYAWFVTMDEQGELDGGFRAAAIEGEVFATLVCHNFIGTASATLIRRRCLDEIGGFDCGYRAQGATGCEDWDLYLRVAARYQFCVVPQFMIGYRKHSQSMSSDPQTMLRSHELMLRSLRDRGHPVPAACERFSRSSLSLYLAREAGRVGRLRDCRSLLREAWQASPVWTLMRVSFYRLLIACLLHRETLPPAAEVEGPPRVPRQRLALEDLARRQIRTSVQIACQRWFHRCVNMSQRGKACRHR